MTIAPFVPSRQFGGPDDRDLPALGYAVAEQVATEAATHLIIHKG